MKRKRKQKQKTMTIQRNKETNTHATILVCLALIALSCIMISQFEIALYQQKLCKSLVSSTNQHTNQEWASEACAFKTTRVECRSLGRCDWKPPSFLQRMDFRHFNVPRVQCKEDETSHKHLVYELANYGMRKIVTEESILFPEGLNEEKYSKHIHFDTQIQLQKLIIPEIDEVTVDAIFKDFLVEHELKRSTEGQLLKAMSELFLDNENQTQTLTRTQSVLQHFQNTNNRMDVGSKLSILYLLYKCQTITPVTRGIFEALRCPDYTFFQKINLVNNIEKIKIDPRWLLKGTLITIAIITAAVLLYMQASDENKGQVQAVVQSVQEKIISPESATRVIQWMRDRHVQLQQSGRQIGISRVSEMSKGGHISEQVRDLDWVRETARTFGMMKEPESFDLPAMNATSTLAPGIPFLEDSYRNVAQIHGPLVESAASKAAQWFDAYTAERGRIYRERLLQGR